MNYSYAICKENQDYPASLELMKIYEVIEDEEARTQGFIRVIDESREDYLYPQDYFVLIEFPPPVLQELSGITSKKSYRSGKSDS